MRRKPGSWRVAPQGVSLSRATCPGPWDSATLPGILVVGSIPGVRSLRPIGRVQARWGTVRPRAVRAPADLVVVGAPASGVDALGVIDRLKDDPVTAAIPAFHDAPPSGGCPGCRADLCLSAGSVPGQLARVAEALLELARARARSSGLYAASLVS